MTTDRRTGQSWVPTRAHLRALLVAVSLALLAVADHRSDLVVLATPFLAVAVWSAIGRPSRPVVIRSRVRAGMLHEGEPTRLDVEVDRVAGLSQLVVQVPDDPWLQVVPTSHGLVRWVGGGTEPYAAAFGLRPTRWGRPELGAGEVMATSPWGAYRWGPVALEARPRAVLPNPAMFDVAAPTPRPIGLVGMNRSLRPGEGSEFASIRPFQLGDRLRRIHWRVTMRTDELHVTSTWSDQDSKVVLVVDATADIGESEGVDGAASSLDIAVRAASAIAEHYLRRGDRVGVRIVGTAMRTQVPATTGRLHLVRIQETLAGIKVANTPWGRPSGHFGLDAGTLVVVLSPLVSARSFEHVVTLASRGLTVLAVDTLPPDRGGDDESWTALAWRIRMLERETELRRVRAVGIPVVPWRGPGSLDQVLRDIGRRAVSPRMVRR